jgi:hypothetical protein
MLKGLINKAVLNGVGTAIESVVYLGENKKVIEKFSIGKLTECGYLSKKKTVIDLSGVEILGEINDYFIISEMDYLMLKNKYDVKSRAKIWTNNKSDDLEQNSGWDIVLDKNGKQI